MAYLESDFCLPPAQGIFRGNTYVNVLMQLFHNPFRIIKR